MNPDILHRKLFYTGIWIFSLYHTSESIFSCFHLLPNSGGAWPSVLFTSEQQNKINMAFVIILLKLNLILGPIIIQIMWYILRQLLKKESEKSGHTLPTLR